MSLGGVTIISGGQTGVDTAALRVASRCKLSLSGWVPKGYINESGYIAPEYRRHLRETTSSESHQRTELNIRDASHILTLQRGADSIGGSKFGLDISHKYGHGPHSMKLVNLNNEWNPQIAEVRASLQHPADVQCAIGGPRESEQPGIEEDATCFLLQVFQPV